MRSTITLLITIFHVDFQKFASWVAVLLLASAFLCTPAAGADAPISEASLLDDYIDLHGGERNASWDFVQAENTQFVVAGRPWYPVGTNAFYAAQVDVMSSADVYAMFKVSEDWAECFLCEHIVRLCMVIILFLKAAHREYVLRLVSCTRCMGSKRFGCLPTATATALRTTSPPPNPSNRSSASTTRLRCRGVWTRL